jgi:hypothetical protein
MKKSYNAFGSVDRKIDRIVNPFWKHFKKYFPLFSALLLIFLLTFFLIHTFKDKSFFATNVLAADISKIVNALNQIDKDCSILSIESEQNSIDFLTVKAFVGSEIGSLNLGYPKNWHGPYLLDNPRFQGKLYRLVKNRYGAFVVPGYGTKLPNGLIIGKDFVFSYDSDVVNMLEKGGQLNYKGTALGAKLEFKIGDLVRPGMQRKEMEQINDVLKEFNAAMPFTQNKTVPYKC